MKVLRKKMFMKRVIAVELVVILLLAGVGVAYALPQNTVTPNTAYWAGTASITESGDLTVTDYSFTYNPELTQVTGVTVEVTNGDTGNHTADIDVAILDSGDVFKSGETLADENCTVGASDHTVTLTTPVALADVDKLNIILTDNG